MILYSYKRPKKIPNLREIHKVLLLLFWPNYKTAFYYLESLMKIIEAVKK